MTLFSYSIGQGQDIILLHGWGIHSLVWKEFAPILAKNFRVTVIDLPGYGDSAYDTNRTQTLPQLASAVLEHAPPKALWLGWSLGGLIASYLATYYQNRVLGLITLATNIKFVACQNWPNAVTESVFTNFAQELNHSTSLTLWRFLSLTVFGTPNIQQQLRQLRAMLKNNQPHHQALLDGLHLLKHTDMRQFLGQLRCPTLAIFGQNDILIPAHAAQKISWHYPIIKTHIINDAAHAPFLTHPKKIGLLIKQYYDAKISQLAHS